MRKVESNPMENCFCLCVELSSMFELLDGIFGGN